MASEHYEIRVEGVLGERWTAWFEGLQISAEDTETATRARWPIRPPCTGSWSR
jgi:hypothetical protein